MGDLNPFELLTLGSETPSASSIHMDPLPPIESRCEVEWGTSRESSRKRLRKEIRRFGRNIRQRLYGFLSKDCNDEIVQHSGNVHTRSYSLDEVSPTLAQFLDGQWEAGPQ